MNLASRNKIILDLLTYQTSYRIFTIYDNGDIMAEKN